MSDHLKVLLGAAGGALLALLLVGFFRNATGYGMMSPMMGGTLFGGLFVLLLWATLAAPLVASVVYVFTTPHRCWLRHPAAPSTLYRHVAMI